MYSHERPKWQQEVESILASKFQGDELKEKIKKANDIMSFVRYVEVPSGDTGELVATILNLVSRELRPRAAVYAGFQLGIALERYQETKPSPAGTPIGQVGEEVARIAGWTEREKCILQRYSSGKTYGDIGTEFDVSRERARQIIHKALRKLFQDAEHKQ
jgi:DNA-binding CsgD family transcriptional regulator